MSRMPAPTEPQEPRQAPEKQRFAEPQARPSEDT